MTTIVPPSLGTVSFNCPHCRAFAHQIWLGLFARILGTDESPSVWRPSEIEPHLERLRANVKTKFTEGQTERIKATLDRLASGEVAISDEQDSHYSYDVTNVHLSQCFSCKRYSVWIYDRLVHPYENTAPPMNPDLPIEIRGDYEEAAKVLAISPRGAAALLRLVVQRLLWHLGEKGKNINEDIASLVAKGLDVRVQQALDVVRVVGNSAVHPGQIDIKDDVATATTLFGLVNAIVDSMISQPLRIQKSYSFLPESKRLEIEKRDKKKP